MNSRVLTGPWPAVLTPAAVAEKYTRSSDRLSSAAAELMTELAVMRQRRNLPSSQPPTSDPGTRVLRLLLVDACVTDQMSAQRALSKVGYEVTTVGDGETAHTLLHEPWDVVVCDLKFGLEVALVVRRRCPHAKIVLWTGELTGLTLTIAKQKTGAHAVVQKVAGIAELQVVLDALFTDDRKKERA